MAATLKGRIVEALQNLDGFSIPDLLERRYQKFRRIGVFHETPAPAQV
jgi:acetyl-CoA carboxylase alpha subunit